MPDPDSDDNRAPTQRWRYGPLRLVLPVVAVVVGAIVAITRSDGPLFLPGLGLIVLGVVMFFVYRWQAKRGS